MENPKRKDVFYGQYFTFGIRAATAAKKAGYRFYSWAGFVWDAFKGTNTPPVCSIGDLR